MLTDTKRCNRCGETKPITEFYANVPMPDGRLKQCRACRNAAGKATRAAHLADPAWVARERERTRKKQADALIQLANHIVQREMDCCRHELNELGFRDLVLVGSVVVPGGQEMVSVVCRASGEAFQHVAQDMHQAVLGITMNALGDGELHDEGATLPGKVAEA